MTSFEEYTPVDVASQIFMLAIFQTKDWAVEYLRGRLTEIYDREFVDQLLPFQREHYFDLGKMETITDEDLETHGFYEAGFSEHHSRLDESLFHIRSKIKKVMEVDADFVS
jgi:hypothetical protein